MENSSIITVIELVGISGLLECRKLTAVQLSEYIEKTGDEFESLITMHQDNADVSVMGILPETCSVIINDDSLYEDLDEINLQCMVISYPRKNLLNIAENEFCYFHSEIEEGVWGILEINGEFDESKLVFFKRQYELPNGDDVSLLTAEYDGKPFGYGSPDQNSVGDSVYDYFTKECA